MCLFDEIVWLGISLIVIAAEMLFMEYHFEVLPHTKAGIFFAGVLRLLWGFLHLRLFWAAGSIGYLAGVVLAVTLLTVMATTLDRKYGGNGLLCTGYLFGFEAVMMLVMGLLLTILFRFPLVSAWLRPDGRRDLRTVGVLLLSLLLAVCIAFPICSLLYRAGRAGRVLLVFLAVLWESVYWMEPLYQAVTHSLYGIFVLMGFLLLLYSLSEKVDKKKIQQENQILSELVREQYEHYRQLQELREEIRRLRHDLANHMQVLRKLRTSDSQQYRLYEQELLQQVDRLKSLPITGQPVLDCVITEKEKRCSENGIRFDWKIEDMQEVSIENFDVVGLFSNLLDNAIEACLRTGRKDACIELHVKRKANYLMIKIYNTKLLKERMQPGKLQIFPYFTLKEDKSSHGLGMQIIQKIVHKYDGSFTYEDRGETFVGLVSLQCDGERLEKAGEEEGIFVKGEKGNEDCDL